MELLALPLVPVFIYIVVDNPSCRQDKFIAPPKSLIRHSLRRAYLLLLPIRKINANPTIHVIITMMRMK